KLGLHARAAARLVAVTSRFSSRVRLRVNGREADGKSIMSVMMLAAGQGTEVELAIEGEDECAACQAVCELFSNRFDEAE
ncbi:MAG: HPr family phosphocarrier protein, partial [Spongiibacteraceae bacterium]|nr:HPr family phosphocarrier protein [Spongiibacteraceae bacterium]